MTERTPGRNVPPQHFDAIPTRGWSDPSRREAFEGHFGTPLGQYGYEFNGSQYARQVAAVMLIGDGVAAELNKEGGDFRPVLREQFNNPDGTFSGGLILFGASSREAAERIQPEFERRINEALGALGANIRLGEPTA